MIIEDFRYYTLTKNTQKTQLGLDQPDRCLKGVKWWYNYPIQDFNYKFNSWAFRGPEYTPYVGKKVNICLGDSFTLNLGGPIEHSWPSFLSEKFDIPCLNLGMDGAGNDAIKIVYDRAIKLFNVQNTFVMHTFLHRRLVDGKFTHTISFKENFDQLNIFYFEDKRIIGKNVFFTFLPLQHYFREEQKYLYENYKNNIWHLEKNTTNRDGYHLDLKENSKLAEWFYGQFSNSNS